MRKFKNSKGFTLIEMLIVVAIIAILIAISIPLIGTALERARDAVDQSNERSAAALGNIVLLTYTEEEAGKTGFTQGKYDAATHKVTAYYAVSDSGSQGTLVAEKDDGEPGKCTGGSTPYCTAHSGGNTSKVIEVVIDYAAGTVATSWK